MIWIGLVIAIFLLGGALIVKLILDRFVKTNRQVRNALEVMEQELSKKREIMEELAQLALGLVSPETLTKFDSDLTAAEEALRTEKGKVTITEAEIEAVDLRLRELEELKKEIEVSAVEASRELEMLRSQQREISSRNEELRLKLEETQHEIDLMMGALSHSAQATEELRKAKLTLAEYQKKMDWYTEQIAVLNEKYMMLKKAYDALDIEYAQLYEKQQAQSYS